ncbi:MAG: shikimate kinase [Bacteroidales bacterium]|jgi:shikimate kinase
MAKFFLVGYSGAGKSYHAKKISKKLNLNLLDTDKLIEDFTNSSISDILYYNSEEYFRNIEREILKKVIKQDNCIVATGGGLPCFFDNMDLMLKNGIVIYLKLPPSVLANRVVNSNYKRPLLHNKKNLDEFIKKHLLEREKFYLKAKYIVNSFNGCEDELIEIISKNI